MAANHVAKDVHFGHAVVLPQGDQHASCPAVVLLGVLLAAWLAACTSWKTQHEPLQIVVAEKEPKTIRVTTVQGDTHVIREPLIRADTLYGWFEAETEGDGSWETVPISNGWAAIPTDDVLRVEVRESNTGRTVLLASLLVVGASIAIAAAVSSEAPPPPSRPSTCQGCDASCPLVYSWDGEGWRLDSGTFGGAIFQPLARTDVDNLDPGD